VKQNCWEFKKCGRQSGGERVRELGVCPAATETRLDAVHGGRCAGRACWVVAGTLCKSETQGTFAVKFGACETCAFYLAVREEEFPAFQFSSILLNKIR